MIFAKLPLEEAEGCLLAHSCATGSGRIAKGTRIGPDQITAMRAVGLTEVTVARLEAGDVEENAAAQRLATALLHDPEGQGLRMSAAGTGRVNLLATGPGVVMLEAAQIDEMNAIDPMITLATLAPLARVEAGTMVATIKIISYAVPEAALQQALAFARDALRIAPPVVQSAVLLETEVGTSPTTDKGLNSTRTRLDRLGIDLLARRKMPHRTDALARAIKEAPGDLILILTGSATSDPHDVAPAALREAGGHVEAYGMPVDPGNLLFFGDFQGRPVIGLPGCARSPALNGADWVLERLACGIPLAQRDIQAMGVGGLLKEIPSRPQPRQQIGKKTAR